MAVAVWSLCICLVLVGLVGSVVPLLPGTTLIFAGVLIQKWLLPDTLSWVAVAWIGVVWAFSMIADIACTVIGSRLFGGSRWGMAGASGGALAGMFFSLPALLLGTMLGAVVAEKWFGKRTSEDAFRSGMGAALGFLASTLVRVACALVMVACYAIAALVAIRSNAPATG